MRGDRKSIRVKGYDYSQPGGYDVTVCIHAHKCVFGNVKNCEMVLNDAGRMIEKWWQKIPDKYNTVEIDEYRVMPNHFHGIIKFVGADACARPNALNNERYNNDAYTDEKGQARLSAPTVGTVIQWFKTMSTNEYIRNVKTEKWLPFDKRLWQRNYYEHIIRNESDLTRVQEYIVNNPAKWEDDEYYTESIP